MTSNKSPANVKEIHYRARSSDGKLWLDETVNLTDHACPFSSKIQGYVTIRDCSLTYAVAQIKGKQKLSPAHCFPRAYITSYHGCPHYKKGSK